jgi:hypothetical protein
VAAREVGVGGQEGSAASEGAAGGGAWHSRWRSVAQVVVTAARLRHARATQDRAATADVGSSGRHWAGGAARFGCEWAGRGWE